MMGNDGKDPSPELPRAQPGTGIVRGGGCSCLGSEDPDKLDSLGSSRSNSSRPLATGVETCHWSVHSEETGSLASSNLIFGVAKCGGVQICDPLEGEIADF